MKTIELMINGQKAQFTTKSVTLEGKEYFYSKFTQLDHSPIVLTYKFECDGEEKLIRYEKKDAKILAAIFSQVHKMIEQRKEKAAEQPAELAKVEEKPAEPAKVETPAESEVQEEKKEVAELEKTEEASVEEAKPEKEPMDPEKKAKLKKSLSIFGIVLAVIIALSIIYYFVFGTSNAPSDAGPGVTESQQYEDIDQLIEDLE